MAKIDELLQEHSLHSVRSDGSQMIALETARTLTGPEWEILFVNNDGRVNNDGTMILDTKEKAILRKVCSSDQLRKTAALQDFVEWRSGVLEEHPHERALMLEDKLQQAERDLQEMRTQYETATQQLQETKTQYDLVDMQLQEIKVKYEATDKQLQDAQKRIQNLMSQNASRRKERADPRIDVEEIEQRIKSTAAAIAERTPSETQKIIANQVELGTEFYKEVGIQSHESFHLSLWLTIAGGCIFFLTVAATVLVTLLQGNSTLITIIGTSAAAITEGLAASNRLYNQASRQFADFQIDLDRINRSSICYAIISEEGFEKKAPEQQETIIKIIDTLLQSS